MPPRPGAPPLPAGVRPPPPGAQLPPPGPAQIVHLQQMIGSLNLPPPVQQQMLSQMAHLPPAQQQAMLSQISAHHSRIQQQMSMLSQPPPPPGGAPPPGGMPPRPNAPKGPGGPPQRDPRVPHRVGKRMTGNELQLVMRHQALQLQINDPLVDDFYHHFWVVKGGHSKAKPLVNRPATISTERKKLDDAAVGSSLGSGAATHRTPDIAVRTPKKLLVVPTAAGSVEDSAASTSETAEAPVPTAPTSSGAPLASSRWLFRDVIDRARSTLVELRVHASSQNVMTPHGQQLRAQLLQRLHETVHSGNSGSPLNVELFNDEKGRKLLVDLLPLWPPGVQSTTLHSFLSQLPQCLQTQSTPLPEVPALAVCLASLPKQLPPEESARLLDATTAHGPAVLKQALERSDVTALLLGVLCCPGIIETCPTPVQSFYGSLLPIAATSESPWALLNALLPVATVAHAKMLQQATGTLQPDAMSQKCREEHTTFSQRLQQHVASLR
jgi:hypothetical protein